MINVAAKLKILERLKIRLGRGHFLKKFLSPRSLSRKLKIIVFVLVCCIFSLDGLKPLYKLSSL